MLSYTTYTQTENTPWVTFIHGAGGSSSIWYKQIRDFTEVFNVLTIDLRGHGDNETVPTNVKVPKYTFDLISDDILEVIDYLKIKKSHFIGISLGTILIRDLAGKYPERIDKMVLAGAIMKLDFRSQVLIKVGDAFKSVLPYMFLYKLFAYIILPRKNHRKSRFFFIREAKKMCQKEFIRWFKLTADVNPLLKLFRKTDIKIPTLYIMGEQDYLFLPTIEKMVTKHLASHLHVVESCGHVVNIEKAIPFNEKSIEFLFENS